MGYFITSRAEYHLSRDKHVAQFIVLLLEDHRLVLVAFGERNLLVQLHFSEIDLHVLLGVGQHNVSVRSNNITYITMYYCSSQEINGGSNNHLL